MMPEGYIRKRSSTIPFGYELDNNTKGFLKTFANVKDGNPGNFQKTW